MNLYKVIGVLLIGLIFFIIGLLLPMQTKLLNERAASILNKFEQSMIKWDKLLDYSLELQKKSEDLLLRNLKSQEKYEDILRKSELAGEKYEEILSRSEKLQKNYEESQKYNK